MLRPKAIPPVLAQVVNGTVKSALFRVSPTAVQTALHARSSNALFFSVMSFLLLLLSLGSLFNGEGALLAGHSTQGTDEKLFAAIVANVWKSLEQTGHNLRTPEALDFLLLDFEVLAYTHMSILSSPIIHHLITFCPVVQHGRVAVVPVSKLLLCLVAEPNTEFGLLRAKAVTMHHALHDPLSQIIET